MKKNKSIRDSATSGFIWSLLERCCAQGISLAVSIVLARILDPSNYGVVAIVTVFTTFCTTFVINGFGKALVQKKDADELDFNSIFYTNILISIILYFILFFAAPFIAKFYKMPELIILVRAQSFVLPLSALCAIQNAYMQKHMQFKKYFIVTLISTIISGVIGIIAAVGRMGVWALVIHTLAKQLIDAILLYFVSKWKPKLQFSIERVKELFPYGLKVLLTSLISNLEAEIRALIIGKKYSKEDLAFYNNGATYPKLIFLNIGNAITRVMLPVFSKEQNDPFALKNILRRSVQVSLYVVMPLLAGLIAVAEPMVRTLYSEKWLLSVPFIQIISLSYLTQPYENSCAEALFATGRSGVVLVNMIVTKLVSFLSIVGAVLFFDSVYAIAWTSVLWTIVSVILYACQISHYFNYKISEQLKDIMPSLILSAIMCGIVYGIGTYLSFNSVITLGIQIIAGVVIYISLSWVFRLKPFKYLVAYAKDIVNSRKKKS